MTNQPTFLTDLLREFDEQEFGAMFSFPSYVDNATAHHQGSNGPPQIYAGKYVTHEVRAFLLEAIRRTLGEFREKMPEPFVIPVRVTDPDYGVEVVRKVGFDDCRNEVLALLKALEPKAEETNI